MSIASILNHTPSGAGQVSPTVASSVTSTESTFVVSPTSGTLPPGGSLELTVEYLGGQPGAAKLHVISNDPDESPLPLQLFGETDFLDPGEAAVPFTLESWTYDHDTGTFAHGTYDLTAYAGKVVYFQVFGTW